MSKLFTAILFAILFSVSIFAQTSDTATTTSTTTDAAVPPVPSPTSIVINEYRKNEFYVGYSNQQIDDFDRSTFHGFEGSYTRNVHRYLGIRASISGAYRTERFSGTFTDGAGGTNTFDVDNDRRVYNFLGGIQIKDNASTSRLKPFGFAMGGVAVNKGNSTVTTCTTPSCTTANAQIFRSSDTGLAGSFGGGLDIRINDRIDFRAIQVDYNPIYSDSRVDNNFRFGIGFVFK